MSFYFRIFKKNNNNYWHIWFKSGRSRDVIDLVCVHVIEGYTANIMDVEIHCLFVYHRVFKPTCLTLSSFEYWKGNMPHCVHSRSVGRGA